VIQKVIIAAAQPASERKSKKIGEDDFLLMLEKGQKEGSIDASEVDLIKNIFELDDTQIKDVFTSLQKITYVSEKASLSEVLQMVQKKNISRIPVLSSDRKQVVGIIHSKDVLKTFLSPEGQNTPISSLMRKPFFVPDTLKLSTLFHRMKKNKIHLAVVTDPIERHTGIITMDDVLEEIFQDVLEDRSAGP
jgi:CBS domain containing-hemolysin-like protein